MPKTTRSAEKVDAVRDKILDIAFKILIKNGYESLSMAKIGSRMGMTAANLYNYYTNKDALLIAIHKKAYMMLYNHLIQSVEKADTSLEKFKNMTHAFVEFGMHNINIYDIMFNRIIRQYRDYIGTPLESTSFDEFQSSQKVRYFAIKIIQDYLETRPDLQPADPIFLTLKCIITLHGLISLNNSGQFVYLSDNPEIDMIKFIDDTMDSVIR
jgi:AcrR family transcriptional regulator